MRPFKYSFRVFVVACLACSFFVGCTSAAEGAGAFRSESLGEGVWLFQPTDPGTLRTNSMVVERDDGLLVVDAQPTPAAARALLSSIAAKLDRPVRYLVLSQPHAEAAGGASAFPKETLIIGTQSCREALQDEAYDFGAEMRARTGSDWSDPPRRPPVLELLGKTRLADSRNPVEIWPLRQSHSQGDLMVVLEHIDLLYAGGILFPDLNPYPSPDTSIGTWLDVLNQISKRSPTVIVGIYGPPSSIDEVRRQRDAFAWARGQVEEGFVDRLPPEKIKQVALEAPGMKKFFGDNTEFAAMVIEKVLTERQEATIRTRGRR